MPDEEKDVAPILVSELFPEVRRELLQVLNGLSPEEWARQTAAPQWSVKDVALHLLGGDVSNLSRRRDAFRPSSSSIADYRELVDFINSWNAQWVGATRRMSPRLLCDLLALTGPQLAEYFASLDPFATGGPVEWAGPDPVPVWLDIAREYTEQWHHQQQIRDATGRPPLYARRLFAPVLDTFMRATPHVYRDVAAPEGTAVKIRITGDAGGTWFLARGPRGWKLLLACDAQPAAAIDIPQEAAWRLFTKGLRADEAKRVSMVDGDPKLSEPFFGTISVIA